MKIKKTKKAKSCTVLYLGLESCFKWPRLWVMFFAFSTDTSELVCIATSLRWTDLPKILITGIKKDKNQSLTWRKQKDTEETGSMQKLVRLKIKFSFHCLSCVKETRKKVLTSALYNSYCKRALNWKLPYNKTSPSMHRKCLPATWKYLQRSVGGVITGRVAFTANQTTIIETLIDSTLMVHSYQ